MADDRDRNQGMKQGDTGAGAGQQGGAHQAPARNPQEGQEAGGKHGDQKQGGNFDPNKGGDGGSYKEGGQNEQTRR